MEPNSVNTPDNGGSPEAEPLFSLVVTHLTRIGLPFTRKVSGRTTTLLISFREEAAQKEASDDARADGHPV